MPQSTIQINIDLDENKVPQAISWKATDSSADIDNPAKSLMVSFWDGADKSALRIDLWTKEMMVDEMADFFYQNMMGMADTYLRATRLEEQANDMKEFARQFYKKFRESQIADNK
jgi:gliding motility-associated protein GldC